MKLKNISSKQAKTTKSKFRFFSVEKKKKTKLLVRKPYHFKKVILLKKTKSSLLSNVLNGSFIVYWKFKPTPITLDLSKKLTETQRITLGYHLIYEIANIKIANALPFKKLPENLVNEIITLFYKLLENTKSDIKITTMLDFVFCKQKKL